MKISTLFYDLFESESEDHVEPEVTDEQIAEMLRENCGPWIEACSKNPKLIFYRGYAQYLPGRINKKQVRQDRVPRDSSVLEHELGNKMLSSFGNNSKWRSNSAFVTASNGLASTYGISYRMVPIGKFDTLCSYAIMDLSVLFSNLRDPDDIMGAIKKFTNFYDGIRYQTSIDKDNRLDPAVIDNWIKKFEKTSLYTTITDGIADFIESFIQLDGIDDKTRTVVRKCICDAVTTIYGRADYPPRVLSDLLLQLGHQIYSNSGSVSTAFDRVCPHVIEFGLADWPTIDDALKSEFQKAKIDTSIKINVRMISVFDRLRNAAVKNLISRNSDTISALFVDLMCTIAKNLYVYYSDPSKMDMLKLEKNTNEIMVRCDEYYMLDISDDAYDKIMSKLISGKNAQ